MTGSIRSFIAIDIDSEEILTRFTSLQKKLMLSGGNLKLVEPQNIHVTMNFLGDINPILVEKISNQMEGLAFSPFHIEIAGVGAFPSVKRPRTIWADIHKGKEEITNIYSQLEQGLTRLGFKKSNRKFSPHITISRVKSGRNRGELAHCLQQVADYFFGNMQVSCVKLKKSVLSPHGPTYSTLTEIRR
jgi:2'-5' RNA ligase